MGVLGCAFVINAVYDAVTGGSLRQSPCYGINYDSLEASQESLPFHMSLPKFFPRL